MVRAAGVRPGELVFDLGAGAGAITGPLAAAGARVIAVERDPRLVRRLQRRFAGRDSVRIVAADVRSIPLPHRPFRVVANIPFDVTTSLITRLLDAPALQSADLVVAAGVARALVARRPANPATLCWSVRFSFGRGRYLPAGSFVPPPSVDAAVVQVRRRDRPLVATRDGRGRFVRLVETAYRRPRAPWTEAAALVITARAITAVSRERALSRSDPVTALSAEDWAALISRAR